MQDLFIVLHTTYIIEKLMRNNRECTRTDSEQTTDRATFPYGTQTPITHYNFNKAQKYRGMGGLGVVHSALR